MLTTSIIKVFTKRPTLHRWTAALMIWSVSNLSFAQSFVRCINNSMYSPVILSFFNGTHYLLPQWTSLDYFILLKISTRNFTCHHLLQNQLLGVRSLVSSQHFFFFSFSEAYTVLLLCPPNYCKHLDLYHFHLQILEFSFWMCFFFSSHITRTL